MAYYAPSVFYPIIGASHDEILRYAAKIVRQPVFLINDAIVSLPDILPTTLRSLCWMIASTF